MAVHLIPVVLQVDGSFERIEEKTLLLGLDFFRADRIARRMQEERLLGAAG